jgi:GcrA cell cycle regulator
MPNEAEWEALIPKLRELWASGMSTPKIAEALHTTKNSVVGKAHRLDLPGRPSPIKGPDGDYWARGAPGLGGYTKDPARRKFITPLGTLPPLASVAAAVQQDAGAELVARLPSVVVSSPLAPRLHRPRLFKSVTGAVSRPKPVAVPSLQPAIFARTFGRVICCLWPLGEPGTPSFRFCDDPSARDRVYCEKHCGMAYIPGSATRARTLVDDGERRVVRRPDLARTAAPDWAMEFSRE